MVVIGGWTLGARGNAMMDEPIKIRQLLGAAIAYVPALFVISGLRAFFVGFLPRATIGLKR